jgi:hypothetical protein
VPLRQLRDQVQAELAATNAAAAENAAEDRRAVGAAAAAADDADRSSAQLRRGRSYSQDGAPTSAQCRDGEWCWWIDTNDADRLYMCRRAGGVLKKTELA